MLQRCLSAHASSVGVRRRGRKTKPRGQEVKVPSCIPRNRRTTTRRSCHRDYNDAAPRCTFCTTLARIDKGNESDEREKLTMETSTESQTTGLYLDMEIIHSAASAKGVGGTIAIGWSFGTLFGSRSLAAWDILYRATTWKCTMLLI